MANNTFSGQLEALVKAKIPCDIDFKAVAELCHEQELQLNDAAVKAADAPAYTFQMAAYLCLGDINNARFLWKRAPAVIGRVKEFGSLWKVGQTLWKNDLKAFYDAAVKQQFPTTKQLITALIELKRQEQLDLVGKSYSTVSIATVATLLGLDAASPNLQQVIQSRGWNVDGSTLHPRPAARQDPDSTSAKQLEQLTKYAIFLEN